MKKEYEQLLSALKAAVSGSSVDWEEALSEKEYTALYRLSMEHSVLPLVVEALSEWPLFDLQKHARMCSIAKDRVIRQAARTAEFRLFYRYLEEQGLHPALMKGIILRNLYPIPEQRDSVDEDLLIPPEEISCYHEAALAYGLKPVDPGADIEKEYELAYEDRSRYTYIEIHKTPFPSESDSYGFLNRYFTDAYQNAVSIDIDNMSFRALEPTDHLLFLIIHAYKHFLHGGIGIRQICDLNLFTRAYSDSISWDKIISACDEAHIARFAKALYDIGRLHLGIENQIPEVWQSYETDELPLLDDIMSGGLYGVTDENRAHSSTLTLSAASGSASHKVSKIGGLLRTAFPSPRTMARRYPYVRKHPILLPVSWVSRLFDYLKKTKRVKTLSSKESLRIGNERIELMRKYEMIR